MRLESLVLQAAQREPERVAVRGPDGAMSYGALSQRAGQVACALREAGVRRGDRVGVWLEKSTRVVAAAITKAEARCGPDVASMLYAAFDPRGFGREVEIEVGPTSGRANIRHILRGAGITVSEPVLTRMLTRIRNERRALSTAEVCAMAEDETGSCA